MKIAFSDYDGTLSVSDTGVTAETIEAIHAWSSSGNKFGIVTGRSYDLIAMETNSHKIPVDFYICCNGAAIHEPNGKPITSTCLLHEAMAQLFDSSHIRTYEGGMLFFTPERSYSYGLREDIPAPFLTPIQNIEDVLCLNNVIQMGMMFCDREAAVAAFSSIDSDFPNMFTGNINRQFLDLNHAGVNKSTGIASLVHERGWEERELLIIGDDRNDLTMIEAYKGFTVSHAEHFMHDAAYAVYDSVGAMLRDYL